MSTSDQLTAMAAAIKLPESAPGAAGIFDNLEALKLSLEAAGLSGAMEVLSRVPVRKPMRDEYFRIRPGDENCFTTVLYEDRGAQMREYYFVAPAMIPVLRAYAQVSVATLMQFYTRQGVLGIFPLKLASDTTTQNGWNDTAMKAAQLAKTKWVRIQADMALSGYRIFVAEGELGDPKWPDTPFSELLDIAFKDRVIATEDHPVINKVLGRI